MISPADCMWKQEKQDPSRDDVAAIQYLQNEMNVLFERFVYLRNSKCSNPKIPLQCYCFDAAGPAISLSVLTTIFQVNLG